MGRGIGSGQSCSTTLAGGDPALRAVKLPGQSHGQVALPPAGTAVCVDPGRNFRSIGAGRSGQNVAAAKVDAGGGEGTVRLLGGCGSRDGDARLEFALVGDL
jgi:hypothetical protein